MLATLEHQKVVQTQQHARLKQEIVHQRDEQERVQGLLRSVAKDGDDMRKEIQTLSKWLTQALKYIGDLTVELVKLDV